MARTNVRLSGFGGQGIILAGVITAKAAVEQDGIYATQTQSYGAESRGGACMANVVLSQEKIDYPEPEELDILVAMSQSAVVLFCEPGTVQEETVARFVKETGYSKPIVAFVAGGFVADMPGTRFGHAAVIVHGDSSSVRGKQRAMREAGITVVDFHSEIVAAVLEHLDRMGT